VWAAPPAGAQVDAWEPPEPDLPVSRAPRESAEGYAERVLQEAESFPVDALRVWGDSSAIVRTAARAPEDAPRGYMLVLTILKAALSDDEELLAQSRPMLYTMARNRPEALAAVIDHYEENDPRRLAATLLGTSGSSKVLPTLVRALRDEDPMTRANAALAIGRIGDPRGLAPLLRALAQDLELTKRDMVNTQREYGPSVVTTLPSVFVPRSYIIRGLSNFKTPEVRWTLLNERVHVAEEVRVAVMDGLAQFAEGDPLVQEALLEGLEDHDAEVRQRAALALVRLENEELAQPLFEALARESDDKVRLMLIRALGKLEDPRVARVCIRVLKVGEGPVQVEALRVLQDRTGQDFGMDHAAWLAWWEQQQKAEAEGEPSETLPAGGKEN
jgi:HEAT repeat protein